MKRYYKGFYGTTASITEKRDGTARLVVRDYYGNKVADKNYETAQRAKVAMGRYVDGWVLTGEAK